MSATLGLAYREVTCRRGSQSPFPIASIRIPYGSQSSFLVRFMLQMCPLRFTQFLAVCSASILAVTLRIGSLQHRADDAKIELSFRHTPLHTAQPVNYKAAG